MMRWHYLSGGKLLKQPSRDALVILHAEAPREAIWAHPLRGGISVLLADNNWEICCQVSTKDNEIFFSTRIIGKKKKTWVLSIRDDFFLFNLIFIKKNQIKFFFKKNQNWFKSTGFSFDLVFWSKTSSNRFDSIFSVWLGFFQFDSVFFRVFFVWVRFGFFGFRLIKSKQNRTGRFFQNCNLFFFAVRFFRLFFFQFSRFNLFFSFFCSPLLSIDHPINL
jgi:hypothetical protein